MSDFDVLRVTLGASSQSSEQLHPAFTALKRIEEQYQALVDAAKEALDCLGNVGDAVDVSDLWPNWDRAYRALAVTLGSLASNPASSPEEDA